MYEMPTTRPCELFWGKMGCSPPQSPLVVLPTCRPGMVAIVKLAASGCNGTSAILSRMSTIAKMRPAEEFAWKVFFDALPLFSDEAIANWVPGAEPPDVLCTTATGKTIGVELTRWLVASDVRKRAGKELQQNAVLHAIASGNETRPQNIGYVNLEMGSTLRLQKPDYAVFKQQLYDFLAAEDSKPPRPTTMDRNQAAPDWSQFQRFGQALSGPDFVKHPILAKYLSLVRVFPRTDLPTLAGGVEWVMFPDFGGFSSRQVMVTAAVCEIKKKVLKYQTNNPRHAQSLGEFDLICHTSEQTLKFNGPLFDSLPEVAAEVSRQIAGQTMFDRIFLFHDWEMPKAVRVYP